VHAVHPDTFSSGAAEFQDPRALLRKLFSSEQSSPDPIPDVRGMLAENHRFAKLNLEINKAYVGMARQFQDIYDPDRNLSPSWYAFAPFASRQAGDSIRLAEGLTERLASESDLDFQHSPAQQAALEQEFPDPAERERAALILALQGPAPRPNEDAPEGLIGDVRHLAVAAHRLKNLMTGQSGTVRERFARVTRTARNMLEAGNLAIVAEIGVAGQDYLTFRQGREPNPEQVLEQFTVEGTPASPSQARKAFEEVKKHVLSGGPLRTDWEAGFSPEEFDRSNFLVAAFAAYEAARLEPKVEMKNRWIEQAGVLMAYREQKDTVQPAFDATGSNEVSRKALMKMGTPWITVPTHNQSWSFRHYAEENLPPGDDSSWTPRAAEYNWGDFPTRWDAILNFFETVFEDPGTAWPMPNPDPREPLA